MRFRLALSILLVAAAAHATSSVKLTPAARALRDSTSCPVSGRFVEARASRGHVIWVFERLASGAPRECAIDGPRFEVWIWEGSWSKLSGAAAYPVYVEEPRPGAELDLRLERRTVDALPSHEKFSGWFLAGEQSSSAKVRVR